MSFVAFDSGILLSLLEVHLGGQFVFLYETAHKPIEGGEYAVFALADATQCRQVAFRIPKALPGPITSMKIQAEIDIRRRIDVQQLERFQPLLASDPTADNDLHRAYMIIGWADGQSVKWSDNNPRLDMHRQRVLSAIANSSIDLLQVNEPGISALQWITRKIDRKIARAKAQSLPYGTISECEKQKSLTYNYWIPHLDHAPHVLVHGDLSGNNVIVDDDFNVTSIIDFGWAEMVPLQFAAEFPRILVHEPVPSQAGFSWTQTRSPQLQKDRDFYLQCIKDRAEKDGGIAQSYFAVLSRKDEVNRYWWYTAASRADVHRAMSLCGWDPMSEICKECERLGCAGSSVDTALEGLPR